MDPPQYTPADPAQAYPTLEGHHHQQYQPQDQHQYQPQDQPQYQPQDQQQYQQQPGPQYSQQPQYAPPSNQALAQPPNYGQPAQNYAQPQAPQVVYVAPPVFGTLSSSTTCPQCNNTVFTMVEKSISMTGLLCCFFGLGLFSFLFDAAYKFTHHCPTCRRLLGEHSPSIGKSMIGCGVALICSSIIIPIIIYVVVMLVALGSVQNRPYQNPYNYGG